MSKYQNNEIFKVIGIYNVQVGDFVCALNNAICITDDVLDRKVNPNKVLDILSYMSHAMQLANKIPGLIEYISPCLNEMIQGEYQNLAFIVESNSNEDELRVWKGRGKIIQLMFECLCFVDNTFDTIENREWLDEYVLACGIYNDCQDVLRDEWEDFHQCRRNYVILTEFSQNIYYSWRDKKVEIIEASEKIIKNLKFPEPKDSRLNMCRGGNND